jgi:hypothetical protein
MRMSGPITCMSVVYLMDGSAYYAITSFSHIEYPLAHWNKSASQYDVNDYTA